MSEHPSSVDLLVIGGGINGVGIARDAAGRGLSVLLVEKDDLASHTSSWSTKLIHGGLRYLEHKEFRLVRESLQEREVLLRAAPHLIRPLRFILPHHKGLRPAWMLRAGLFLYDHIGGQMSLEKTKTLDLSHGPLGAPLNGDYRRGFEYTDCMTDDARLVIVNAMDARDRGATLLTRTRFSGAQRTGDAWSCQLQHQDGSLSSLTAKAIVNAGGPWVTEIIDSTAEVNPQKRLRLVKGSHLVVRQLFDHDRAYIFQNTDNRIVFAIPYLFGTTLIGTTDEGFEGDPAAAAIDDGETDYLLILINSYFQETVTHDDIVWSFSGVRPLYDDLSQDDLSAVTRDYAFDIDRGEGGTAAPLLSVYGGKLTTYRKLAEHAVDRLAAAFPSMTDPWTRDAVLPGGHQLADGLRKPEELTAKDWARLLDAYGSKIGEVIGDGDLGKHFGAGLWETEVRYLITEEWARTVDDILWRRTKLGLRLQDIDQAALAEKVRQLCHALPAAER